MKKILILGGSDLQVSIIKMAKRMKIHVITCDYLPSNPGHKYSDEYFNISTTDKEMVLELAKEKKVDGILAYASDPAAPVAAWVCEKLSLPTNPYKSVLTLSRKDLFRKFMKENGFKTPNARSFSDYSDAEAFHMGLNTSSIIKPVDSSGSKGVFKLEKNKPFEKEFLNSLSFSKEKKIIIEEFIEKKGYQIGGDGLLIDGKLVFHCFGDVHFSSINPLLPCSVSVPSLHCEKIKKMVHIELQRLLGLAGMKMGGLNFDVIVDENEEVNILEIGARNGGNMIPELTELCTGIDMKEYNIKLALGIETEKIKEWHEKKYFSHYVLHSSKAGKIKQITRSKKLENHIIYEHLNFSIGDNVNVYENSSDRLGIFLLKYSNKENMLDIIYNMNRNFVLEYYE